MDQAAEAYAGPQSKVFALVFALVLYWGQPCFVDAYRQIRIDV